MSSSPIKTVAIAAASGDLGSAIFNSLLESGKFDLRVLKRAGSASKSSFPPSVEVFEVDYKSVDSLLPALKGVDAVVSAISSEEPDSHFALIDAAVAQGVRRFLPSDFGSDLHMPATRQLPVYRAKVATQDYLADKTKGTATTWTLVYNSAFLDWGLSKGFALDTSAGAPTLFDGGDAPFATTTLPWVSEAVIGVLTHLEQTANRPVYVSNLYTTQNKMLAIAKRLAPEREWKPVVVPIDAAVEGAYKKLEAGDHSFATFVPFLLRAVFDPAYNGDFTKDNELLGIKQFTDEDLVEVVKANMR